MSFSTWSDHVEDDMLRYGSNRIRKHRTIRRPRKMKRMRTKTKAALCSSVRKDADDDEDEEMVLV